MHGYLANFNRKYKLMMKIPDWSKKMNAQKLNRAEHSHVLLDNEYRENADGSGDRSAGRGWSGHPEGQ